MANNFQFVDTGWGKLLQKVEELASSRAQVGAIGPDAKRIHPHRANSANRVTIAEALLINEYGTGASAATYVPARAPLRRTFRRANPVIREMGARAARMLISGSTAAQALGMMGKLGVEALRSTLAGDNPPSNAPRTIQRKGFDHPLIWTGMLWESIASRIVKAAIGDKDSGGVIELGGND